MARRRPDEQAPRLEPLPGDAPPPEERVARRNRRIRVGVFVVAVVALAALAWMGWTGRFDMGFKPYPGYVGPGSGQPIVEPGAELLEPTDDGIEGNDAEDFGLEPGDRYMLPPGGPQFP